MAWCVETFLFPWSLRKRQLACELLPTAYHEIILHYYMPTTTQTLIALLYIYSCIVNIVLHMTRPLSVRELMSWSLLTVQESCCFISWRCAVDFQSPPALEPWEPEAVSRVPPWAFQSIDFSMSRPHGEWNCFRARSHQRWRVDPSMHPCLWGRWCFIVASSMWVEEGSSSWCQGAVCGSCIWRWQWYYLQAFQLSGQDQRIALQGLCLWRGANSLFHAERPEIDPQNSAILLGTKKAKAVPFEDRDDEDIDRGFDYIMKHCPRPAVETQQLRWMTKTWRTRIPPFSLGLRLL